MSATIYYDNANTYQATINVEDGSANIGNKSFSDGTTLTNEERAIDQDLSLAITDWGDTDALRFDFGSAVTVDYVAIYSTATITTDIRIFRSDSATGTANVVTNLEVDSLVAGWNILHLSSGDFRYRILIADGGSITGITEIYFGARFALPVQPTANIITAHNFGSEEIKTYGANRFYFSKHNNYKEFTLNLTHMTSAQKTELETFANTVTDRMPFIYAEDSTVINGNNPTGPLHYVKLVRPLTFKTVLPDIFSCQVVMRELTS